MPFTSFRINTVDKIVFVKNNSPIKWISFLRRSVTLMNEILKVSKPQMWKVALVSKQNRDRLVNAMRFI